MAAAADRLLGDVLECVSPELVLVDAALSVEVRRHLEVPEDTLTRLGRLRVESPHASKPVDVETPEPVCLDLEPPEPQAGIGIGEHELGIEDLIVIPEDEPPPSRSSSRMYPLLPTPPGDSTDEDATDVVLRQIRDHFEVETPSRRTYRALTAASFAGALSALAIFAVDLQLGIYELPRWLQI